MARALGEALRHKRRTRGLLQAEVAARLSIPTRGTLANWELGNRTIDKANWNRFRAAFGPDLPDYEEIHRRTRAQLVV